MLKYCLDKWNKNKDLLEKKLRGMNNWSEIEYVSLVKLVVRCILNEGESYIYDQWAENKITVVDNGDYQGTLLFVIPQKCYQPTEYEYLLTYVGYGSCSGCDTLQRILDAGDENLTEEQINDLMKLCKDILTNIVKPYNGGWRYENDFEQVEFDEDE